ncbi:MAG: hypothetical protein KDD44_01645, partial [Bdellovibrionales bacterium]|nr:hypothetical protein [Bdellovibrionales bacterium]
ISDDAYMTFRVVRNFLSHGELVYNLGERVYSSSTPLFSLLLTIVSATSGVAPDRFFLPLLCVIDVCNLVLLYLLVLRVTRLPAVAGLGALLYGLSWVAAVSTATGMEGGLFVLCIQITALAALARDSQRNRLITGGAAGLAALARPEGAFLAASLCIVRFAYRRRLPWEEAIGTLLIMSPWWLFAYIHFGSIIPHAALAKDLGYFRLPGEAARDLIQHFFDLFVFYPVVLLPWGARIVVVPFILLSLLIGVIRSVRARPEIAFLFLFNVFYVSSYLAFNPFLFYWYKAGLEPAYILAVVSGSYWLLTSAGEKLQIPRPQFVANLVLIAAIAALITQYYDPGGSQRAFTIAEGDSTWRTGPLRPILGGRDRERLYLRVADELKSEVSAETTIMAPEFGALGYVLPAKMISNIGHVNPEILQFLPVPRELLSHNNAITVPMVKFTMPDYIITLDIFIRKTLAKDAWFNRNYKLTADYPTTIWNSTALQVFRRLDCATDTVGPNGSCDVSD